jgi:hypothetical protein
LAKVQFHFPLSAQIKIQNQNKRNEEFLGVDRIELRYRKKNNIKFLVS